MLSVDVPPAYVPFDSFDVGTVGQGTKGNVHLSNRVLEAGVRYFVKASGTATMAQDGRGIDAEFGVYRGTTSDWRDYQSDGTDWGLGLGQYGSGAPKVRWGSFAAEHEYGRFFTGTGKKIVSRYYDNPSGDNSGSLTVEVFAPVTIDSLTVTDREDAENEVVADAPPGEPEHLSVFEVPPAVEGGQGEVGVSLSAAYDPSEASPGEEARWKVLESGASPATGTFADDTAITFTPTEYEGTFTVQAWVDLNENDDLDSDETYREVSVHVVGVEVDLNDTEETNDDAVRRKTDGYGSGVPAETPTIAGEVRLVNADYLDGDVEFELSNAPESVGQVAFAAEGQNPSSTAPTRPITLSSTTQSARFSIAGVTVSGALNDVSVRVVGTDGKGVVQGRVLSKKGLTVFWFNDARVTATPGAAYAVGQGIYAPSGGVGVTLEAWASIQPVGLENTIPQIRGLRIGIVQNTVTVGTYARVDGTLQWLRDTRAGTQVDVSAGNTATGGLDQPANDYGVVGPLYDPMALAIPFGLTGASKASTSDSPGTVFNAGTDLVGERSNAGNIVAELVNSLSLARYQGRFRTWCVLVDTEGDGGPHVIAPLRQTEWTLNVRSDEQNQRAAWNGQDFAVAQNPVLGGQSSNVLIAESGQFQEDPAQVFTKPLP